jgi:hypothetical protein
MMRRKLPLWAILVVCFLFAIGLVCLGIFYDDESLRRRLFMLAGLLFLFDVGALFVLTRWLRRGEVTWKDFKAEDPGIAEALCRDAEMDADPSASMSVEQLDEAIKKRRRH